MSSASAAARVVPLHRPPPLLPGAVLGMSVFLLTEVMFFAGLLSAFLITKASATFGWPPPGQPRLPAEETLVNSAALLVSGALLFWAGRVHKDGGASGLWLWSAAAFGAFFVLFQGAEWAALLGEGLTLTSGKHGAFFYVIVGAHALHAVAGLAALVWLGLRNARGALTADAFQAMRLFWYFVVLVWPPLYVLVYW